MNVNDMFANVATFPIPQGGWKEVRVSARGSAAHTGSASSARPQAFTATRLAPVRAALVPIHRPQGRGALRLTRFLLARDRGRRLGRRWRSTGRGDGED